MRLDALYQSQQQHYTSGSRGCLYLECGCCEMCGTLHPRICQSARLSPLDLADDKLVLTVKLLRSPGAAVAGMLDLHVQQFREHDDVGPL